MKTSHIVVIVVIVVILLAIYFYNKNKNKAKNAQSGANQTPVFNAQQTVSANIQPSNPSTQKGGTLWVQPKDISSPAPTGSVPGAARMGTSGTKH